MNTQETNIKFELEKYGFATVDYPQGVTGIVQDAMNAWQKFCQLPLETKSHFIYTGDSGAGYEYKNETGETKDRKENFHFSLGEMSRLSQVTKENGIDESFVSSADALLTGIEVSVLNFAQSLEEQFGIKGLREDVYASKGSWLLRYLHYFPGAKAGKVIAAHHCDKVSFTMYLQETTPGVEYYSQKREWISMPILQGKTIVTPNMQIQYKTHGKLKALYHRVVANEKSAIEGRYSIVCFIYCLRTPQYYKEKYGRLQDMPLAFNYDMPFEEFSKLFI